jgi:hypothetical protein
LFRVVLNRNSLDTRDGRKAQRSGIAIDRGFGGNLSQPLMTSMAYLPN